MPFQLSPGVAVVEKDFSSIVPAVSTSVGAFAGVFQWGPVNDPVTIDSENTLVSRFGKPNDATAQSFFTAANFLSYTNNLLTVRVDTTDSLNAVSTPRSGVDDIDAPVANTLSGVLITGTGGQFSATVGDTLWVGMTVVISGTLTGDGAISTYTTGTAYKVSATNGSTTFTLTKSDGSALTTTAGTTLGLTFTVGNAGSGYVGAAITGLSGNYVACTVGAPNIVGGIQAVAYAKVETGSITEIVVTNKGFGYTSRPLVTIAAAPSGGTNAYGAYANLSTAAGVKIKNFDQYESSYDAGEGIVGPWVAKYPGVFGNSLTVAIADEATFAGWTAAYKSQFDKTPGDSTYAASVGGESDEMHILVIDRDGQWSGTAGTVLEKFAFVSKASDAKKSDGTNNYYKDVINTNSKYIWWTDHTDDVVTPGSGTTNAAAWGSAAAGNSFKLVNVGSDVNLTGGADDHTATDGQLQAGFDLFANAEQYDISLIPTGPANAAVSKWVVENVAQERLDCVVFVSPTNIADGSPIIGSGSDAATATIGFRNNASFNVDSSYAVLDSGYKYQYDRYADKYRWVPLNGDIAGLCARTDYTNDPWWSPGGLSRGQIKNVVKLAFNPGKTERDTLYKAGVNPVVTFPGQGTVLFGDKTLQSKPSAFDRINVRRLFITLEKAIATASKYQLFEFNDSFTRAQFKNLVEPFLRDVQGRRGVIDFRVKCDDTNNTGEVIDRNEFVADIFIKPARSINFITLNFVAARTSVNFEEIGG